MPKKSWGMDVGEQAVDPTNVDELLKDSVSKRRRREIERQEEVDEASHKAKMAELEKKKTTAEVATEKTGERKEEGSGFKVTGGVNLGTIDLQEERREAREQLERMKGEADDTARATGQENQQLRDRIHEQEMKVISTSFEAALASVKEKLESKGSVAEQIAGIRAMAKELGMTQPEPGTGDPALQLQILQMQHAEAQRDREFQWQMQKDREAREDRKEVQRDEREARQAEGARQARKDEMFAKTPEVIGRAIAAGMMESEAGGGEASQGKGRGHHIEVGVGQSGELECAECGRPVAVGPTARTAVCANCGARYPVKRTETEAPPAEEEE